MTTDHSTPIAPLHSRFATFLETEFRPRVLATSLVSGVLVYIVEILVLISLAVLTFSGKLSSQLFYALGVMLVGTAILTAVTAVLSSLPGSVAVAQDTPAAILAATISGMLASFTGASAGQDIATAIAIMMSATVFTGVLMLALGAFNLGRLVRFVPYPVMGGFLAGTGWLLASGGVGVMLNAPFSLAMFEPSGLARWLPGMLGGAAIVAAARRFRSPLAVPVGFFLMAVLFYAAALLLSIPLERLSAQGWLLGPFPSGSLFRLPISAEIWGRIDWRFVAASLPAIVPVGVVGVIALLLNANGLELVLETDIDLNRELIAAGFGNVVGGLFGASAGYHAISVSTLSHTISGQRRLPALISALLVVLTAVFGGMALVYVPRMALGALLVYLGLGLLYEWVYQAWFRFARVDHAVILLILAVIILRGFLEGIGVGLVATSVLFIVNYSRITAVKIAVTGSDLRSRVTRSPDEQQVLREQCDQIYILKLQGYLFFGTANALIERIKGYVRHWSPAPVHYLLLDFTQVTNVDSTALRSLSRLRQWSRERRITVVLTGLHAQVAEKFAREGLLEEPGVLHLVADFDHGIEWCEDELLRTSAVERESGQSLADYLTKLVPHSRSVAALIAVMERRQLAAGDCLIREGDDADAMYFIESGQVTAHLDQPDRPSLRLETVRGGRTVGELGFYLGTKRSASVIADEPTVVYALSRSVLDSLEASEPEAAAALHRIVAHLLGERVVHLIRTVDALQR